MKAEEFVVKLKEIAPTEEELISRGYTSSEHIKRCLISYNAVKRESNPLVIPNGMDELLRLVTEYDCNTVELGMVCLTDSFNDLFTEFEDYYLVGVDEVDYLVISKKTGEVLILDRFEQTFVICYCAANGAKFLDALIEAQVFIHLTVSDEEIYNDQSLRKVKALKCADLAGDVDRYYSFFYTHLGCED